MSPARNRSVTSSETDPDPGSPLAPASAGGASGGARGSAWRRRGRVIWTALSYLVVQSVLLGVAAVPAVVGLQWILPRLPDQVWGAGFVLAVGLIPTYTLCAMTLAVATAAVLRVLGWHARAGLVLPIAAYEWPLMDWARGGMCTHVVRLLVGTPFRGTPIWTQFVRLNGARVGRGVWINSVAIIDHHLLAFGDGTVIGHEVHLSGHTVERGCLRTGTVRVERRVTIGVGAVIGIDVEIGDDCQVGALSVVPKGSRLDAGATYVGAPVRKVGAEPQE